jgi:hypothetical protein
MSGPPAHPGAHPAEQALSSWVGFAQEAERLLVAAAEQGAHLTLVDADFRHWPLSSPAVLAACGQWAVSHPRCQAQVLAQDWRPVVQHHGGWLRWRTPWGHRVSCLQSQAEDEAPWPGTLLVAHGLGGLRVVDPVSGRGRQTADARQLREWLREVDVILQRSVTVTPLASLGL